MKEGIDVRRSGITEGEKIENMTVYEREKIEATLKDARHLVEVIENYLKTVDYCDEKGIELTERPPLEAIRRPGQLADPNEALRQLSVMFESGMTEMAKSIDVSHKPSLEAGYKQK